MYEIVVRNKDGDELGKFNDWLQVRFSQRLNNYGTCEFSVPVTSADLTQLVSMRRYETLIKKNGSIVWSGEQANRFGTLSRNSANPITIVSHTFEEMFNAMYTASFVRYEQVDEGQILKNLIDDFQNKTNGDLGFTFGSYLTGTLRDREYENANILDAYVNMSNVINGPDFYVTHDKVINIVPFKGVDRSKQVIFEWGINIEGVDINEDFSNPASEVIGLGAGFGSEQLRSVQADANVQKIIGLRQQSVSEVDVSIQSTLDQKTLSALGMYKQPVLMLSMTQLSTTFPHFGMLQVGDLVRFRAREGIFNINNTFRIYGYDAIVSKDGKESISYILGVL